MIVVVALVVSEFVALLLRSAHLLVLLVAADGEETAVDLGVQGLDASIEALGRLGVLADVLDFESCLPHLLRGAAGGEDLAAKGSEVLGELHHAGFVED